MSKRLIKFAASLQQKKFRKENEAFTVEGEKSVFELLNSNFQVLALLYTENFYNKYASFCDKIVDTSMVTEDDLLKAGSFQTNSGALAIVKMPSQKLDMQAKGLKLVLDQVKDPGNLGTIIRLADWYGVSQIICSEDCVDVYNPKTIAATMGSFLRMPVFYTDLAIFLAQQEANLGAFLGGKSIYEINFPQNCCIVIGNESNGISEETAKLIQQKVTIPRFGKAESLNAGMATAVFLDNYRRQNLV